MIKYPRPFAAMFLYYQHSKNGWLEGLGTWVYYNGMLTLTSTASWRLVSRSWIHSSRWYKCYRYHITVIYNHHFSEGLSQSCLSHQQGLFTLSHPHTFPECNITCPDGYTVFDDCSGCELTDICLAETPCLNGGTCYLVRAPNDYRCDCPEATEGARCEGGMSW